ncbi:helix-turn-helix transcriptional regulator [Neomegalonema sp.]|uniref:helix-turn-helix domain-containing protein n=1 Tax=Neomegalonema sp. TaxID=2039713 RepID=UPI00260E8602|nr:helix-turn-helix transcriptional regulator [Neomegalonema sp.]MDD2870116.1 helix-turn-helix transcriptional regulator [Neomegalonema sp.]
MKRSARIARAPRGWHPEEIKAAIRMRGSNMAELSRQHGYGASAVRQALRRPYPAMERIVADHLGVAPEAIWPDRYDPDGTPNRGRSGDASLYRTAQSVSGKPATRFTGRKAKTTSATASSRNSAAPSGLRGEVSSPVEALRAPASIRLVSSQD